MNQRISQARRIGVGVAQGFLMGGANVVPGVSAGTVALVLGFYQRLVTAISHFDLHLLSLLKQRRWADAAKHVDLYLLSVLGAGTLLGILMLGGLMNHLITTPATRSLTLAAFFGLIVSSAVLVARLVPLRSPAAITSAVIFWLIGVVVAYGFTSLRPPDDAGQATHWYLFLSGMLAICATILPGISGAYVLLIMGVYTYMTGILKRLPQLDVSVADGVAVVVFMLGCGIGLVSFSKLLRWLLANYQAQTMALLCGFMVGALRKIWPFQRDLSPPGVTELKHKVFQNYLPESFSADVAACCAVAVVAMAAVFAIDWLTRSQKSDQTAKDGAA